MSPTPTASVPKARFDWIPLALVAAVVALSAPLIASPSTWLALTAAGLAMGLIVFVIASGLTLVFGLMDVLNFGHGVFVAFGAFVATSVMAGMADWAEGAESEEAAFEKRGLTVRTVTASTGA